MFKKGCLFLIVFAMLLLASGALAQDGDWEMLFYDLSSIQVMTEAGIVDQIEVPAEARGIVPFTGLGHVQLSPDRQHLVFVSGSGGGEGVAPLASVQIANLAEQTCCRTVPSPDGMQPDAVTVGPFSPDGTQFVVNFAQIYSQQQTPPLLAVVDLETLEIVHELDMMAEFGNPGAFLETWTTDGILLFPTCLACGGPVEGYYARWNPETGEIDRQARYVNFLGDRLEGTGEYLIPERDESRPVSNGDGMFPPANVIAYLPDSNPEQATQVYFDPQNLDLARPNWVADGQAYLLHNWGQPTAVLIFRDGHEQVIDLPADLHFVTGTPDGWLMQRNESVVYQFQITTEGQVTSSEWSNIGGSVVLLETPVMGHEAMEPLTPILK